MDHLLHCLHSVGAGGSKSLVLVLRLQRISRGMLALPWVSCAWYPEVISVSIGWRSVYVVRLNVGWANVRAVLWCIRLWILLGWKILWSVQRQTSQHVCRFGFSARVAELW